MSNPSDNNTIASEKVLSQEIQGETVLLDLETERYFGLDEVGSKIWQLINKGADRQEMLSILADEFDVGEEILVEDVERFVASLAEAGLVSAGNADSHKP